MAISEPFLRRLIENGVNIGIPSATVIGIRATTSKWVLLLNNDATIEADVIQIDEGWHELPPERYSTTP